MSDEYKKRNHYVWRKYLESWEAEGQVYCLRDGLINKRNSRNLAVEKYFYKIDLINPLEYEFIKMLGMPNGQEGVLKKINEEWLQIFDNIFNLLKSAKFAKDLSIEKTVTLQAMEDFHCQIENRGVCLGDLLRQDVDFWKDEDKRIDFLFYLFFQYFRTKRRRNACLDVCNNILKKSCVNNLFTLSSTGYAILSAFFSSNMAYVFSNETASIRLIRNNSGINFITGDQPVVNIIQDKTEGELYPRDVELYYPVSPKLGIFVSHNATFSLEYEEVVSSDEVISLNGMIADDHEEQLFGNRREDLMPFLL
jgi:hypothetical protein